MLLMLPHFRPCWPPTCRAASVVTLGHPMLVAVKAWALSHLLVNGTVADVLLFGGFLAWAVADRISMKHRPAGGSALALPRTRFNDAIVVIGGLGTLCGVFVLAAPRMDRGLGDGQRLRLPAATAGQRPSSRCQNDEAARAIR